MTRVGRLLLVLTLACLGCRVGRGVGATLSIDTAGRVGIGLGAEISTRVGDQERVGPVGELGVGVALNPLSLFLSAGFGADYFTDDAAADASNWRIGMRARIEADVAGADAGGPWQVRLGVVGGHAQTSSQDSPGYCLPARQENVEQLGLFVRLRRGPFRIDSGRIDAAIHHDWISSDPSSCND